MRRLGILGVLVVALGVAAAPVWCRDAAAAASDGGPDYAAIAGFEMSAPQPMVEVLPDVWIPEHEVPAWTVYVRGVALASGAIEVDGELVPWSPHRDLIVFVLKPCETGSMGWHEWGSNPRYDGPLQWHPPTWAHYGGDVAERSYLASIADQVAAAEELVAASGGTFRAFPGCRAKHGLP